MGEVNGCSTNQFCLKDSGTREGFDSGAHRDQRAGKGRFDLLSPLVLERLALVMERGAEKYEPRNWERGMPLCRYMDSAIRHLVKFLEGLRDEDHLCQAMFNIMAIVHTEEMIRRGVLPSALNDLPTYRGNLDAGETKTAAGTPEPSTDPVRDGGQGHCTAGVRQSPYCPAGFARLCRACAPRAT